MSEKNEREPWWHTVGPGIVSGASDNDPTTVATLAIIGATTVYGLAWLVALVIPMLAVVQAVSARVGVTCKLGLEDFVRVRYGVIWGAVVVIAVLAVNVITLAADLEAGGAALQLIFHIDYRWFVPPIAIAGAAMLIWGSYERIKRVLMYVTLIFLAYAVAAVFAHPNWREVLLASIVPHFQWNSAYVDGAIALLGTTLTAYAYVWETIEVREEHAPLRRLGLVQVDAVVGTVVAGITFWLIMVATGATLGLQHHQVQTAQDAAAALAPVAGKWASLIFGIGLLGSSLLAVPVLAATAAYMIKELFGWRGKVNDSFRRAPKFFMAMIATFAVATVTALSGFAAIKLLLVASIAAGIATPVTLVFLLLAARDREMTKGAGLKGPLLFAGWTVAGIVTAAALVFLVRTVSGA